MGFDDNRVASAAGAFERRLIVMGWGQLLGHDLVRSSLGQSLQRLFHGPIAAMGILKEVKVVDTSDCIVFLVQDGQQVFPEVA